MSTEQVTLSERERNVLRDMANMLPREHAAPFKNIGGCETHNVRRVVRALARKGMVEFYRGLMDEYGMLHGSGYGVTEAGYDFVEREFGGMKIVTSNPYPPIPVRDFDWCAHYDGEEEAGNYGWGATEAEAIQDFIDNCQDDHDERLGLTNAAGAGQ